MATVEYLEPFRPLDTVALPPSRLICAMPSLIAKQSLLAIVPPQNLCYFTIYIIQFDPSFTTLSWWKEADTSLVAAVALVTHTMSHADQYLQIKAVRFR